MSVPIAMVGKSRRVARCIAKLPPCNAACPIGEDIQRWISLVVQNKFHAAWQTITERSPFPAIQGRVCYHYCESQCNRVQYDAAVNIHGMESYLGDLALEHNWQLAGEACAQSGTRVLIVGAGPAGLAAAYHLQRLGYRVTIYEALAKAGGMMWVGIPAYRLPRSVLFGEIDRLLLSERLEIHYNRRVTDVVQEKERNGFAAVLLAVGAHLGKPIALAGSENSRIIHAVDYLRTVSLGQAMTLGNRVVVYGGGNTAMDVARTARTLGIKEVLVVYHRSREKMPALESEILEAMAAGVKFSFLRRIMAFKAGALTLGVNQLDNEGKPLQTEEYEQLATDALILALNQRPDTDFLKGVPGLELLETGTVSVAQNFMTGCAGIFACGDMIPGERSISVAVGQGRKAAYHLDAYLRGEVFVKSTGRSPESREIASRIQLPEAATQQVEAQELSSDLKEASMLQAAQACFSCGNCFGCGKCYNRCPTGAIQADQQSGKVSAVIEESCIGCGKCFKVCPCGAMSMIDR